MQQTKDEFPEFSIRSNPPSFTKKILTRPHVRVDPTHEHLWCQLSFYSYTFSLPFIRQHPSYGDCLEFKREYYQNCSVLECVTQCLQLAAHLYEQFLQVQQIGFVTLGPYRVHRGVCLELHYCNMVEWFWWDSNLILTTNWFSFSALTLLVCSCGL